MNTNQISLIANSRFRISVHALVWLAMNHHVQSSASLANQVSSHATFLRRVLLPFVQSGLVEAREGRDGGYLLKVSPEQLTLADVYLTVNSEISSDVDSMDCGEAGIQLDNALEEITKTVEQQVITTLRRYTVADLVQRVSPFG